MEEVGLTAEQIQALTAVVGGEQQDLQLAYLSEDGSQLHQLSQLPQQQQVIIQQHEQVVTEDGLQQLIFGDAEERGEVLVLSQQPEVVSQSFQPEVVQVQESQEVDLDELLRSGALRPEDLAALAEAQGADTVVIQQQEEQREVAPLLEQYLVQCAKCGRTFKPEDFERHFEEVHKEAPAEEEAKPCSVCGKDVAKRDYLAHFKAEHSDVRLGCPKCPQTYHSPELLNVHYKHFHLKEDEASEVKSVSDGAKKTEGENVVVAQTSATSLQKCKLCGKKYPSLQDHLRQDHPGAKYPPPAARKRKAVTSIFCEVCLKTFDTQRDFSNHKRRKGFCRPPVRAPPPQTRRIGIIRKSL